MSALSIDTEAGNFRIELHVSYAPHTCRYFSELAKQHRLNNGAIFRITTQSNRQPGTTSPINVIQLGTKLGLDEPRRRIVHESTNVTGMTHRRYTVSASRFEPGEVYASFFVCMRDEPELDFGGARRSDGRGYASFGEVIVGRSVLDNIYNHAQACEVLKPAMPVYRVRLEEN